MGVLVDGRWEKPTKCEVDSTLVGHVGEGSFCDADGLVHGDEVVARGGRHGDGELVGGHCHGFGVWRILLGVGGILIFH